MGISTGHWSTAKELTNTAFETWKKAGRAISPVAVIATVDEDGRPRTAPFGSLKAVSPHLLRFCCSHYHETYKNLIRDGSVSILMISPPDISVSVVGKALLVKNHMECDEHSSIFEVKIETVKNDMVRRIVIEESITIRAIEGSLSWFEEAMQELDEEP